MKKTLVLILALMMIITLSAGCTEKTNGKGDVSDIQPLEPALVVGAGSYAYEVFGLTTIFEVPEGWSAVVNSGGWRLDIHAVPPQDDEDFVYTGNPKITIIYKEDDEGFIPPEHQEKIDDKVIGGIEMEGNWGIVAQDSFLFYRGVSSNGIFLEVLAMFGLDVESGEGKAVMDSIQFTVG